LSFNNDKGKAEFIWIENDEFQKPIPIKKTRH
jgi:hypothetical protein